MDEQKMKDLITKLLNGLTDEQKEKVKACRSLNELITCLGGMGTALPDGLLDTVT